MPMEFEAPENVAGEGGNYLSEPGTYHVVITEVKDGEGPKGGQIDGFTFEMDVLAGTDDGCAGKKHREVLFAPDLTKGEGNQMAAKRKLAAFFIATNVMDPSSLGKPVKLDVAKASGKQLLIKFDRQMEKDENGEWTKPTKYLQISYSDIYHVDDPDVKDIPKNADALSMIEDAERHTDTSWFAFKKKSGQASSSKPADSKPVETAASGAVDVGDLF